MQAWLISSGGRKRVRSSFLRSCDSVAQNLARSLEISCMYVCSDFVVMSKVTAEVENERFRCLYRHGRVGPARGRRVSQVQSSYLQGQESAERARVGARASVCRIEGFGASTGKVYL